MTEGESISVSVYLPESMIAYLDEVGKSRRRSRSFLIREWIEGEMSVGEGPAISQDERNTGTGAFGSDRKRSARLGKSEQPHTKRER